MSLVQGSHHLPVLGDGEVNGVFERVRRAHNRYVIYVNTVSDPLMRRPKAGRYENRQKVELQLRGGVSRASRDASGGLHRPAGQVGLA
jgi:hypothetical protein